MLSPVKEEDSEVGNTSHEASGFDFFQSDSDSATEERKCPASPSTRHLRLLKEKQRQRQIKQREMEAERQEEEDSKSTRSRPRSSSSRRRVPRKGRSGPRLQLKRRQAKKTREQTQRTKPRPAWDGNLSDMNRYRLSEGERIERQLARISSNMAVTDRESVIVPSLRPLQDPQDVKIGQKTNTTTRHNSSRVNGIREGEERQERDRTHKPQKRRGLGIPPPRKVSRQPIVTTAPTVDGSEVESDRRQGKQMREKEKEKEKEEERERGEEKKEEGDEAENEEEVDPALAALDEEALDRLIKEEEKALRETRLFIERGTFEREKEPTLQVESDRRTPPEVAERESRREKERETTDRARLLTLRKSQDRHDNNRSTRNTLLGETSKALEEQEREVATQVRTVSDNVVRLGLLASRLPSVPSNEVTEVLKDLTILLGALRSRDNMQIYHRSSLQAALERSEIEREALLAETDVLMEENKAVRERYRSLLQLSETTKVNGGDEEREGDLYPTVQAEPHHNEHLRNTQQQQHVPLYPSRPHSAFGIGLGPPTTDSQSMNSSKENVRGQQSVVTDTQDPFKALSSFKYTETASKRDAWASAEAVLPPRTDIERQFATQLNNYRGRKLTHVARGVAPSYAVGMTVQAPSIFADDYRE